MNRSSFNRSSSAPIQDVIGGILDSLDNTGENEDELLAATTPGRRAIYLVSATDGEVMNGGFAQFFANSTGRFTEEASYSAAILGATEHERIIREAASVFPNGEVPRDYDERNRLLDALPDWVETEVWGALEERWHAISAELERICWRYIREHPEEFSR